MKIVESETGKPGNAICYSTKNKTWFSSSIFGSNPNTLNKDKSLLGKTSLESPVTINKLTIVVPFWFLFSLIYWSKFSSVNSVFSKLSLFFGSLDGNRFLISSRINEFLLKVMKLSSHASNLNLLFIFFTLSSFIKGSSFIFNFCSFSQLF